MRKTLVTSSNTALIPVLKLLAKEGFNILTIRPEFAQNLQNLDLPARPLADFGNLESRRLAYLEAVRVLAQLRPIPKDGLAQSVSGWFGRELQGWLYPRLGDLCLLALVLNEVKPDLVLLHNDVEPLPRSVALWARSADIPCLHVPHAVYMDWQHGAPGSDVHDLVTASHIAVAGSFQRDWYKERGNAEIRETGLPQFDYWATVIPNRDRARRLLRLDGRDPVVVYASSWGQRTNLLGCHDGVEQTYIAFLEAVRGMSGLDIIIKVHPHGGNLEWHIAEAKRLEVNCAVTAVHLHVCLWAADLLLSFGPSNIILEGAHLDHLRLAVTDGYPDDDEVTKIEDLSPDDIAKTIDKVLEFGPPDTRAFLAKYVGITDGKAAERIAAYAVDLCA